MIPFDLEKLKTLVAEAVSAAEVEDPSGYIRAKREKIESRAQKERDNLASARQEALRDPEQAPWIVAYLAHLADSDWKPEYTQERRIEIINSEFDALLESLEEETEEEIIDEFDREMDEWCASLVRDARLDAAESACKHFFVQAGFEVEEFGPTRALSGSRYFNIIRDDPDDESWDEFSVRVSDHPQPKDGGFLVRDDPALSGRAGESDIDIVVDATGVQVFWKAR